jgi:hypothetical protein
VAGRGVQQKYGAEQDNNKRRRKYTNSREHAKSPLHRDARGGGGGGKGKPKRAENERKEKRKRKD